MERNEVTYLDISNILGNIEIPDFVKNRMDSDPLYYLNLTDDEYQDYLIDVLSVLLDDITKSGKHRLIEWENGWNENYEQFLKTNDINFLIPKYHGKKKYVRWMGKIVKSITENFDYKIHINFIDSILHHYLNDIENVYEFGCGPAYHLLRLSDIRPDLNLFGLDWAKSSQNIIFEINHLLNKNINSHRFDFFDPDKNFEIQNNSMVYTIAALEQVGDDYKKFVNYLIEQKVNICIHMEPISELLDKSKLNDYLSIKYFEKRNYLNGFLNYLTEIEKDGKIEILDKRRIYSGSYFIEGHSLVVWRVK